MTQARDLADGKFDTDTLVVSASNDRVGVNNASPDTTMKVNFSSASTAGFGINDTNSGNLGGMLQFYSGSDNGTLRANIMNANNAGAHIALGTSGTVVFGGTSYVAANALDDYEEGEFDVDVSTSNLTVDTSVDRCRYTKIGRMVYVTGTIKFSSVTSSSDTVTITGLPFSSAANVSGGEAYGHFTLMLNNIDGGNAGNLALGGFGTTAATIYKLPESGSFDTLRTSDFNSSGNEIYFSGWYPAA